MSVIPIKHRSVKGKEPAIDTWKEFQQRRPTDSELVGWFAHPGADGVAVIVGDVSDGLVCRDFDDMRVYNLWSARHMALATELPTVATARGRHVYFRSEHRSIKTVEGGELRGAGYTLLPPSRHPTGSEYRWLRDLPVGPLPALDPFACGMAAELTEKPRYRRKRDTDAIGEAVDALSGSLSLCQPAELADDEAIAQAIAQSQPEHEGQRNRCLFKLARHLKGIPSLVNADRTRLVEVARHWHARALPHISTKDFDTTLADLLYSWKRVKFPKGAGPMSEILAIVDANDFSPAALRYESMGMRRLISACRELQRISGDEPFFLDYRSAAEIGGVSHEMAGRWMHMLRDDEVLRLAEQGRQGRASRYFYLPGD